MSKDANPAISACAPSTIPAPPRAENPSEPITLRLATLADAPALALVGAATFLEAFTWMLPGADIIAHCAAHHTPEAYAHYLALPTTRISLAVTGPGPVPDAPVGYAMLAAPDLPSIPTTPRDIELKRIYLFSRFRSSATTVTNAPGIRPAQALMDAAIANARSLNADRVLLGTNGDNARAINFYRRNGFYDAGTRTFKVGTQCCCDLVLALDL